MTWRYAAFVAVVALVDVLCVHIYAKHVRADEEQREVAPYKFADLPHGRIYKAVHEGCELFISEGQMRVTGAADSGYFYTVATGRGCR
jgi:hypothetical protein